MVNVMVKVNKTEMIEALKIDIDRWGKRIQRADIPSTERYFLTGKIEGTVQTLMIAGILTAHEVAKLKVYYETHYGSERRRDDV